MRRSISRMLASFFRRDRGAEEVSPEWEAVTARARADMEARRAALEPMAGVVTDISSVLFEADTIGLSARGGDQDEYDPEAETIVMRLSEERRLLSDGDVCDIVHEEFVRWFGADLAGPRENYRAVAGKVSAVWRDFLADGPTGGPEPSPGAGG